jgi:NADH-quinone oxidoreductase subunit H
MMLLSVDIAFLIEKAILIFIVIFGSLGIAMYATWGERKVAAVMQDRIGPNRAGPLGLFQPLADGAKLFFKEEIIPDRSTKFLFIFGPCLAMLTACMTSAIMPWGPDIKGAPGGHDIALQVADINIGVLYMFGVVSLGVYGIMLGGWASNNKFSLLSSIRSASQAISYELAMGISLIALLMLTNSLSLKEIVEQQKGFWHNGYFTWNIFKQPLGFIIFFTCSLAELNRAPFDLPECESELNMGYHQEYSSMKLGYYLFAEYINMFISSALIVTLFFGGYNFPFMELVEANMTGMGWLFSIICVMVLMAKVVGMILLIMAIRWTLPRFRYDQLMKLGWKSLIPIALINMLITGVVILVMNIK